MREALAARLPDPWTLRRALRYLEAADREALQWILDSGGSVSLEEFAERYEVDTDAPPDYYHPDTVLDRLRVRALVVETAPGGEPWVAIPVELREPLRERLAEADEGEAPPSAPAG